MQAIPEQTQDHEPPKPTAKAISEYFSPNKIEQLVGEFSFSELRKLLSEMDLEFFSLCYFPKYFDRKFGKFHKELFGELKSCWTIKG